MEELRSSEFDELLVKFYPGIRTNKGELYKLNSMRSLRFSLQRYFLQVSGKDIIDPIEFRKSNICFENVLKEIKKCGKGATTHHPEIETEDIQKLYVL